MLKTKPQSPFPSLPAFLGSLPTVQDPCLSQGGQNRAKRAVFSNTHSFQRPGCASARGWWEPGHGAAAGRENHTGHGEGEGAECIPAHLQKLATLGKTPIKFCPAFNSTVDSWISLQSHWEEFLSGIALGRTRPHSFFLKAVAYHFSWILTICLIPHCCLACQEVKIKPPFLCGLFFFRSLETVPPNCIFSNCKIYFCVAVR